VHSFSKSKIIILGAGLCGAAMAALLARRGFSVSLYEKRADLRQKVLDGGRSINLALSHRGLKTLSKLGLDDQVKQLAIPMHGRIVHDTTGATNFQPYGLKDQFINSISRTELNRILLDAAEQAGADLRFNHACKDVDLQSGDVWLDKQSQGNWVTDRGDFIIGADGAFSVLRSKMLRSDRFNYQQHYIEHGYKELSIPPASDGSFRLDPNGLHIWPRGGFMMIALPNLDRTFTVTLFLPFEGSCSFDQLKYPEQLQPFFEQHFPDAYPHLSDLKGQFRQNPTSSLITVRCYPWSMGKGLLMGDAAHAIVPFYGQGMNAALEDCYVLDNLLDSFDGNWSSLSHRFQEARKPDAEAIADLALYNFIEMRDKVADGEFLLRKKIEALMHKHYPEQWIPLYTMVTFSDLSYAEAQKRGVQQAEVMQAYKKHYGYPSRPEEANLEAIMELYQQLQAQHG
jgi:kynurenine 3-monooxygenase